jgi:hypothetical protein
MRTCDALKTTVKLCMFDLYGTIVDMQDPQEGTCDRTSFALPHAYAISVRSFCTGSSTIKSLITFLPLLER